MEQPRVVDLFSGCGGFTLGAHMAGMCTCLAVEVDPILSWSFHRNFPDAELLLADVQNLSGKDLLRAAGDRIDGVIGGPPCQGFSEIGRHDISDPRRGLVGEFFRLVRELKPRFFVMENVRGLLFAGNFPVLHSELATVHRDYRIFGPGILEASDFGAATTRPRMFVVGMGRACSSGRFDNELKNFHRRPATVRDAIDDLVDTLPSEVDENGLDWWTYGNSADLSRYARHARVSLDGAPLDGFTGHRRTTHTEATRLRFGGLAQGAKDNIGRYVRLKWDGQSPSIRAGTGVERGSFQAVRPVHPDEDRVITPREAARLQGFPDWFVFHPTIWHSFRMIGNSVSPTAAAAVLRAVSKCIACAPIQRRGRTRAAAALQVA